MKSKVATGRIERVGGLCLLAILPRIATASCNAIPSARPSFRGAIGSVDRPFVRPGDWLRITLADGCQSPTADFPTVDEILVTFEFAAPNGGPRSIVVLSPNCEATGSGQCQVEQRRCLPSHTDGADVDVMVHDRTLHVRFPNTDEFAGSPADGITLTGALTVAVSRVADGVPCDDATSGCSRRGDAVACVAELFSVDASCGTTPADVFSHLIALPLPNDYHALCTDPTPPCEPTTTREIRAAVDTDGDLLLPMDWRGILVEHDAVPVARTLRASTTVEAFAGTGVPLHLPAAGALESYSPEGVRLPPIFDPQFDPTNPARTTFFGSADAPDTVLRIRRTTSRCVGGANGGSPCFRDDECAGAACVAPQCEGGDSAGRSCATDGDCAGGQCGRPLFDFSDRVASGAGPVVIRLGSCLGGTRSLLSCSGDSECPGGQCGSFVLQALDPVPLDGLQQTEALNTFVLEEGIDQSDHNGDRDRTDHVVRITDRSSGNPIAIGDAGSDGRAVLRVQDAQFTFPALDADQGIIAFLEPEPAQSQSDGNGDGDPWDVLLRLYRTDGQPVVPLGGPVTVDATPVLDGRALRVSNGLVVVRTSPTDATPEHVARASIGVNGAELRAGSVFPSISSDGRFVGFSSLDPDLAPVDLNSNFDVFVHDRLTGFTSPVSVDPMGFAAGGQNESLSDDGRFVTFESCGPVIGRYVGCQVFVRDRLLETSEVASTNTKGTPGLPFASIYPSLSSDGRTVVFESASVNLVPGDRNRQSDVFVHDRLTGVTERVSLSSDGSEANGPSSGGKVSRDGSVVAFESWASNLVPGDTNEESDVFVHDRSTGETSRVSVGRRGEQGNGASFAPAISGDGRIVAFASTSSNLVPGDTNFAADVFVHDRNTGETTRVSVASDGQQGTENSEEPIALSADGRVVAFSSFATLVRDSVSREWSTYVHDRVTGVTQSAGRGVVSTESLHVGLSRSGAVLAYASERSDQVPNDDNQTADVFARAPIGFTYDRAIARPTAEVIDTSTDPPGVTALCPATSVAVFGDAVALLRPVGDGTANSVCPTDEMAPSDPVGGLVYLWRRGEAAAQSLGRTADAIALGSKWLAALVREGVGADAPSGSGIIAVHRADGVGSWRTLDETSASDRVAVVGDIVAVRSDVSSSGTGTVKFFDLAHEPPIERSVPNGVDFVLGPTGIGAVRAHEATGDRLHVFDPVTHTILHTGLAVTPCRLEACDPRRPYRVGDDSVTFLTVECDQPGSETNECATGGTDLNGDGDAGDLVLQTINVRKAIDMGQLSDSCHVLGATRSGVCTNSGRACSSSDDCGMEGAECFVPPGGCVEDTHVSCTPGERPDEVCLGVNCCTPYQFCQPVPGMDTGTCRQIVGPCASDVDCPSGSTCNDDGQQFQRLASPLTNGGRAGASVFIGSGRCVEERPGSCSAIAPCPAGEFCAAGRCRRDQGPCRRVEDCPGMLDHVECRQDLLAVTVPDVDGDEVPDQFDNCPRVPNVDQADADHDGAGDVCDPMPRGCDVLEADAGEAKIRYVQRPTGTIGHLKAKIELPVLGYADDFMRVRLLGENGALLNDQAIGALTQNRKGRGVWRFKGKAPGIVRLTLRRAKRPRRAVVFIAQLRARAWVPATPAPLVLSFTVGKRCFDWVMPAGTR